MAQPNQFLHLVDHHSIDLLVYNLLANQLDLGKDMYIREWF